MREISKLADISIAGLYYHFSSKQELHLAAIDQAYKKPGESSAVDVLLSNPDMKPTIRLKSFILKICEKFHADPELVKLVQRHLLEITNGNYLNEIGPIFSTPSDTLRDFLDDIEISNDFDASLLSTFILGLVIHTYQIAEFSKCYGDYRPEKYHPLVVTEQIMKMLTEGVLKSG